MVVLFVSVNLVDLASLVLAARYAMFPAQEIAELNTLTPNEPMVLSSEGYPLIWFYPRLGPGSILSEDQLLDALSKAEPPVVRKTSETKTTKVGGGDECVVNRVELLVKEETLPRCCYYCGAIEADTFDKPEQRFAKFWGSDFSSLYWCNTVSLSANLEKTCSRVWIIVL